MGLRVPLTSLVVDILDYHQRVPNQFTYNSFVSFGVLDAISNSELMFYVNEENKRRRHGPIGMQHFFYYLKVYISLFVAK